MRELLAIETNAVSGGLVLGLSLAAVAGARKWEFSHFLGRVLLADTAIITIVGAATAGLPGFILGIPMGVGMGLIDTYLGYTVGGWFENQMPKYAVLQLVNE